MKDKAAAPPSPFSQGFVMPAEWEPHAATWLAWPNEAGDWPGKFATIPWVFTEIIRCLSQGEHIRLLVVSKQHKKEAREALRLAGIDVARVDFVEQRSDRSWTRDFVPTFVVRRSAKSRRLAVVKWRFNGWARYWNHKRDDEAGYTIAQSARERGLEVYEPWVEAQRKRQRVVLEGGAIDVDGEGTLLATEECLLTGKQARNPDLGKTGTERVLRDYLGAEKVLWLGHGIAGDDTGGHVDDFARFVPGGRVVLAREKNRKDPNYRPLEQARERLQGARNARGRRIEVIELPMPAPVAFAGHRLPASYANFYVGNEVVLVPTFNDPNDRLALGILAELFPDRAVTGIHSTDLVLGLGTIHCSTQQEPA
jgi:agmatine deiminase